MGSKFLAKKRTNQLEHEKSAQDGWLAQIYTWEPRWLKEDQYDRSPPPIINMENLKPTLLSYETIDEYTEVMTPLITLEFWYAMKKDFESEEPKRRIRGLLEPDNVFECPSSYNSKKHETFRFCVKATLRWDDFEKQIYPLRGDLVKFHNPNNSDELFAFVDYRIFRRFQNKSVEVTYYLVSKPFDMAPFSQPVKLITVTSMSSHLVLIKSLVHLSYSPLRKIVLKPNIEGYKLSPVENSDAFPLLITEDKLNFTQMQVLTRIKTTVDMKIPKICLIQGPPGTGKSQVIVNTIASLFMARSNRRILVCAHSNQAIDEVVLRLLEIQKIFSANGLNFNIVRVGQEDRMHELVKKITPSALAPMAARLKKYEEDEYDDLYNDLSTDHTAVTEDEILIGADVIAGTLTSCCNVRMTNIFGLDKIQIPICLIDEAAQAIEVALVAPLMLGVDKLILIGDTQQLPPTVLSLKAGELGLNMSLFARAEKIFSLNQLENPIIMLNTQYRMADSIAHWPNQYFYNGELLNGDIPCTTLDIAHYKLFNHSSPQDDGNESNIGEANLVVNILYSIITKSNLKNLNSVLSIGIITPYRKQRQTIITLMKEKLAKISETLLSKIKVPDVNTVDSFQGSERDIIIISCVRSAGIGFINDPHRLCVSLTRAKSSLIICGNFKTFHKNAMWRNLLNDAKSRGLYSNIDHDADVNELKEHMTVIT